MEDGTGTRKRPVPSFCFHTRVLRRAPSRGRGFAQPFDSPGAFALHFIPPVSAAVFPLASQRKAPDPVGDLRFAHLRDHLSRQKRHIRGQLLLQRLLALAQTGAA